jgi:hypothetical protein
LLVSFDKKKHLNEKSNHILTMYNFSYKHSSIFPENNAAIAQHFTLWRSQSRRR